MVKRLWDSPTITTWASYLTKALALFAVLPLILKNLVPGDVALWYLFFTIIVSSQSITEFGFRQTFSRIISYAYAGAADISLFKDTDVKKKEEDYEPNLPLMHKIVACQKYIYIWLTVIFFLLMAIFGTWSLMRPIKSASNIPHAWYCWIIVLVISAINFYGKIWLNFLEGLFKIAVVRRIEALTSIGSIISSFIVLVTAPTLLNLIIVNQAWLLIVTLRDWYLCRNVCDGLYKKVSKGGGFDKEIFQKVWGPTWKNGISCLMSISLTNLNGLFFAQVGSTQDVAAYLLALRIINQIKDVAMAPFFSKLPLLAMLRVKGDFKGLLQVTKRGMFLSNTVFVLAFAAFGIFSSKLLHLMHSGVHFVDQPMWILMGIAFFIHRFGTMHMQIYMSTNHVISHIADGISGGLFIILTLVLYKYLGIYSIPLGMILGYMGFYVWYAAKYSYSSLQVTFWNFEKQTSLLAISLFVIYIVFEIR